MAGKKPDRNDARLRERLLDVAESLYAQHGFSEVSFRQICVAAGARNNFAVQYHFGDLDTLTAAILERRAVHYEMRRGELLAEAIRTEPLNVRMILEIMQRPIIELRDEQGEPLGARFMIALQNTAWGWKPLSNLLDNAPVTQQLIRSLEDIVSHLPPPVIWQRVYLTSQMITNCAAQVPSQGSLQFRDAVIRNVFAMAAAAMVAPLDEKDARAMMEFHGPAPDAGRQFEQSAG
jgi:AcrR family transcriptional regulator